MTLSTTTPPALASAATPATTLRTAPRGAATEPPGFFGQSVLKLLAHRATISAVHEIAPDFRLVSLRSESFRTLPDVPGDKLQVRVSGMSFRTYTPLRLARGDDELQLLGHVHGWGPGSDWLAAAAPGESCHVMGPRRSLDLGAIQRSTVFFGDESSLGLAKSLCATTLGGLDTHFIFETGDAPGLRMAIESLGQGMLRNAWLVERRAHDAHLADVEAALAQYAGADAYRQYVFSGKAPSIQRLTRSLKIAGAKPSQMLVKAYWAPGKVGLD